MTMFDLHSDLNTYYNKHVRLKDERKILAGYRNTNLERLNQGLDAMGEDDDTIYAHPIDHRNQGSYAMHTLNQHPDKAYDIDVAIIFRAEDLPASARDARERIAAVFEHTGVAFAQPPEARTNAVTVWYAEGYHIDFAIYRQSLNAAGVTILEHAGADWKAADPEAMTTWFNNTVHQLSPSEAAGAAVADAQMRRIVRWLKAFAKSRSSWNLPGGMIISVLVAECYRPNWSRDDIALYDTMRAISDRLAISQEVQNPIFTDQQLTSKNEYRNQIVRFKDKLNRAFEELAVLFDSTCGRPQALRAWHWVFQHEFWNEEPAEEASKTSALSIGAVTGAPGLIRDTGTYG
jgi:hypothetical protein